MDVGRDGWIIYVVHIAGFIMVAFKSMKLRLKSQTRRVAVPASIRAGQAQAIPVYPSPHPLSASKWGEDSGRLHCVYPSKKHPQTTALSLRRSEAGTSLSPSRSSRSSRSPQTFSPTAERQRLLSDFSFAVVF